MPRVIIAEILKLKRTKILWLLPLIALFPVFLTFFGSLERDITWKDYYFFIWNTKNMVLGPVIFSLITGYVFSREYTDKTINALFTYPYSRSNYLFGKVVVVFLLLIISYCVTFFGTIITGMILIEDPASFQTILGIFVSLIQTAFIQLLLLMPIVLVTIIGKSFIPGVIVGVVAVVSQVLALNSEFLHYFPYSAAILLNYYTTELMIDSPEPAQLGYLLIAISSIGIYAALTFILSLIIYKKQDVHV